MPPETHTSREMFDADGWDLNPSILLRGGWVSVLGLDLPEDHIVYGIGRLLEKKEIKVHYRVVTEPVPEKKFEEIDIEWSQAAFNAIFREFHPSPLIFDFAPAPLLLFLEAGTDYYVIAGERRFVEDVIGNTTPLVFRDFMISLGALGQKAQKNFRILADTYFKIEP